MKKSFHERLIEAQQELSSILDSEQLPERVLQVIQQLMDAENVMVTGVDGNLLGNWWVRNSGWKIRSYSMFVVKKAIDSDQAFWIGGIQKGDPTESQIKGNILSCLAARINAGSRIIGAIYCDIRHGSRRFTEEDGKRLKLLADCLGVYLKYFEFQRKQEEPQSPASTVKITDSFVGDTKIIKDLKADIETTARLVTPVLITGESGVGKEVVARMLHDLSEFSTGQFVVVHCAAISKDLFESELFGHERGAFSGAFRKRQGLVLRADGGTLFLDEVGDIPLEIQVKLLRLLEAKMVRSVGSDIEVGPVNFRLITATNRNLEKMISEKTFREDLFYRIRGRLLRIPPLRDRAEDIPHLATYFAHPKKISDEAVALLRTVNWPGNVRQLKAVIENARNASTEYIITREAVEKELTFQPKVSSSNSEDMNFYELRMHWQKGDLPVEQLQATLKERYEKGNSNWNEVARQWGLTSPEEVKALRNWIYYLQKRKLFDSSAES